MPKRDEVPCHEAVTALPSVFNRGIVSPVVHPAPDQKKVASVNYDRSFLEKVLSCNAGVLYNLQHGGLVLDDWLSKSLLHSKNSITAVPEEAKESFEAFKKWASELTLVDKRDAITIEDDKIIFARCSKDCAYHHMVVVYEDGTTNVDWQFKPSEQPETDEAEADEPIKLNDNLKLNNLEHQVYIEFGLRLLKNMIERYAVAVLKPLPTVESIRQKPQLLSEWVKSCGKDILSEAGAHMKFSLEPHPEVIIIVHPSETEESVEITMIKIDDEYSLQLFYKLKESSLEGLDDPYEFGENN